MKKLVVSFIAVMICAAMLLAACGQSESTQAPQTAAPAQTQAAAADAADKTEPADTQAAAPADEAEPAEETAPADEAEASVPWEDMATIEFFTFQFNDPGDVQHVEDAINEITEKEINTHVHMNVMNVGAYMQQIGVMMAGGETIDVMLTSFGGASFSAMLAQHQLTELSDLLDEYGTGITAELGDLLNACSSEDGIYGIPCSRNLNEGIRLFMRKDVLEDLGLLEKAENMTTVAEYEEILEAVHNSEKWSYLRPTQVHTSAGLIHKGNIFYDSIDNVDGYDRLGDQTGLIYVDKNGKVGIVQEQETYQKAAAVLRDMNEKGLLFYDVTGDTTALEDNVKDNLLFSMLTIGGFGAETAADRRCGMEMVTRVINNRELSTGDVNSMCYLIPTTSQEPEAAVAFLNLCYTRSDLNNLLCWGVEGHDYEVVDGVASFIGDADSADYQAYPWQMPNQFLLTPWEGDTPDFYEQSRADMANCPVSPFLGFTANLDEISTEIASVTTVINEYEDQIKNGSASEATLQEYIDKLHAAGADKIVESFQTQLDAWLAAK